MDAEAGHLQLRLELAQRAEVTRVQTVEQKAPGRVGKRLEDSAVRALTRLSTLSPSAR